MTLTFIELSRFSAVRDDYFVNDESFHALQNALLANPTAGDVIPGCGGIRKIRWPDPRRGKGKRGGLRIIYLHIEQAEAIVFFAVYDKDETNDLTTEQKKSIAKAVDDTREQLIKRFQGQL